MRGSSALVQACSAALLLLSLLSGSIQLVAAADSAAHSDVTVLTDANFDQLTATGSWLIEFYAPWCGHCKVLAPIYEEAATALKGQLQLGKIDATANNALSSRFGIKGFPHLKLLREGEVRNYNGARTLDGLVGFGREMAQPAVTTIKSLEQFNKLADAYPVSAVFFGFKQHGAERRLFDSLAWRLQGALKFFRVEYDSESGSAAAIFSAAGVRTEAAPVVLLVTARADSQDENNRFSGPWGAAASSDASESAAAPAPAAGQSLRDWLVARKLPLISVLDANNFDDLTTTGKRLVLAVVDSGSKGGPRGAKEGNAFVELLYPLARKPELQQHYLFAQVDGPRYHKYVSQFGVLVTDVVTGAAAAPADTSKLPTLVVLEHEQDYYFAPASHPIGDAAVIEQFLMDVEAGRVPLSATLAWYNPSRYLKLLEKSMNRMETWQLFLAVSAFVVSVVASLWWCCANGLDAALGLQLTPEEEEQLQLEKERVQALAKKRDGSAKASSSRAENVEGLKQRKGAQQ